MKLREGSARGLVLGRERDRLLEEDDGPVRVGEPVAQRLGELPVAAGRRRRVAACHRVGVDLAERHRLLEVAELLGDAGQAEGELGVPRVELPGELEPRVGGLHLAGPGQRARGGEKHPRQVRLHRVVPGRDGARLLERRHSVVDPALALEHARERPSAARRLGRGSGAAGGDRGLPGAGGLFGRAGGLRRLRPGVLERGVAGLGLGRAAGALERRRAGRGVGLRRRRRREAGLERRRLVRGRERHPGIGCGRRVAGCPRARAVPRPPRPTRGPRGPRAPPRCPGRAPAPRATRRRLPPVGAGSRRRAPARSAATGGVRGRPRALPRGGWRAPPTPRAGPRRGRGRRAAGRPRHRRAPADKSSRQAGGASAPRPAASRARASARRYSGPSPSGTSSRRTADRCSSAPLASP